MPSDAAPVVEANIDIETENSGSARRRRAIGAAEEDAGGHRLDLGADADRGQHLADRLAGAASPAKRSDVQWMVRPKPFG